MNKAHAPRICTEQEAYQRLSALCAMGERCSHDVQEKLKRMGVDEDAAERIVARLVKEGFIDEERYAQAFANDKFRHNHWGRVKIQRELQLRHIPQRHIDQALRAFDEADNLQTLREILQKKRPSVKGKTHYEVKCKLLRFALGRGFPMDDITKVLGDID